MAVSSWLAGRRGSVLLGAALALLTVSVFRTLPQHAWHNYDDNVYVTRSAEVLAGLRPDSVAWAFSSFHGANWFPLTRLSWMLDVELHGTDPAGFYRTNLALHVLCTLLLFAGLRRLTGAAGPSAFVAAVFAVHPLHVESVAWIAARKDPLSALFFAASLLVYERQARRPSPAGRALLLACLVLGLMAKPVLVTLPFVWLLLDAWPLRRLERDAAPGRLDPARLRRAAFEKWPAFAVVAVFCAVTLAAQREQALVSTEALPLGTRAANAVVSYVAYLGKAFWPRDLAVFYPHPEDGLGLPLVLGSLALLAAVSAAALSAWRRVPALAVGWFWFLGTLVPMIGLVQVGAQAMADRYTYLPLIGLALAVAFSASALLRRWPAAAAIAGLACVAALAVATTRQLDHWRDSAALFEHALAVTRENHIAHVHLGQARLDAGRREDAMDHWYEALRIRPDLERVANNLAWLLATHPDPARRDPREAVALAERAAALSERREAGVLDTLAVAYAADGRFDDAVAVTLEARRLAEADGDAAFAAELDERLARFRGGAPYTEAP